MSEWRVQMSGNGSHLLVWHSSRRQIPPVEKFTYKSVHRVSFHWCHINVFCTFFPLSSRLEKIGMSVFPVPLYFWCYGCSALKMLQRSKQRLCFLLRVKVWQGICCCSALLLAGLLHPLCGTWLFPALPWLCFLGAVQSSDFGVPIRMLYPWISLFSPPQFWNVAVFMQAI